MAKQPPPFDPNELAQWLVEGFQEILSYRLKKTFDKEKWIEVLKTKIPNKNQVVHLALRKALTQSGFEFEDIKQGSATFHLIRKKLRVVPPGHGVRRLVVVPGFGDTPGSWLAPFAFANFEITRRFDEILVLDFPGYSGFLSEHEMVPSMTILLNVVKLVCESNPPTVLVGHSLGGWLAGKVAQTSKLNLDHLILMAPSGLVPEFDRKRFADFIVNNQNLKVDELLALLVHEPKHYHEVIKEEIMHFYSREEVKQFVESVDESQFMDEKAAFFTKKLTVIWGEQDRFVPAQWLRYWVECYGEFLDAYIIKDTGHIPQMESPRAMAQVMVHAIVGKLSLEGKGWKKIHSRRHEFDFKKLAVPETNRQKLLGAI